MKIVPKTTDDRGYFLENLVNGDWFASAASEMGAIPALDLEAPRYYRLTRSQDRQMFEITVRAESPDRQTRLKRLELEGKGQYGREQALEGLYKEGKNVVISSNWGSFFPADDIEGFINYVFEFVYEHYKWDTEFVKIKYIYPVDGRQFEFFRLGEKMRPNP